MSTYRRKSGAPPRSKPHPSEAGAYNRTLIEASLDPLLTFDAHGKITDVNAATEKVTGLSRGELIGTDFSNYFTDPDRARTGYKKAFREGSVQDYALEIRRKDGHKTPVLYNATVYRNAAGEVEGVFAAARDITSLKKAQEELAGHLGRLEDEVRARTTELTLTNERLEKEIADRKVADEALAGERANLQAIFDSVNVGMLLIAEDGSVRKVNEAVLRWLGKDTLTLDGMQPGDVLGCIHILDGAGQCGKSAFCATCPIRSTFEAVLSSGRPIHGADAEATLSIGGKRVQLWLEVNVDPVIVDGRRHVIVALQDITPRKNAEESLRRSEDLMRAVTDNSPDAIYVKDTESRWLMANPAVLQIVGRSAEQALGKSDLELYTDPQIGQAILENDRLVLALGVPQAMEEIADTPGGRRTFLSIKAPWRDHAGKIIGIVGISHDITERTETEEALKKAASDLKRSNEDLAQFAHAASHDLQEPLRMVNGFLKLLRDQYSPNLDEKAREYIGYSVEGATRMSQLIADLLAYSQVERKGQELTSTDAGMVLAGALANLRESIAEAQATVTCDRLPTVMADAVQLMQVFQNLIVNAVKFRSPERTCQVHVGVREEGDRWVFSVSDNGIGIPRDAFDRIFVIFQRLHSRSKYAGTGIGLAICKKVVERHGGQIRVESTLGMGTTFYFDLAK